MRARTHERRNAPHVPAIVVTYLGRLAISSSLISGFLVWRVIETSAGSQQAADAAVIGVVMAFIAVTTGSVAVLGSILASTRTPAGEPGAAPLDVNVKNTEKEPVPTDPQPGTLQPSTPAAADNPLVKPPGVPAADFPSGDSIDSDTVVDPGAPA